MGSASGSGVGVGAVLGALIAVLVITHDVQMVLRIADELVVLQDGAVVERGTESTLVAGYSRRLLNTRLTTLGVSS